MKKTRDGRRRFSRQFKMSAIRRVLEGEQLGAVAEDLNVGYELLWRWRKRFAERGEKYLYDIGQRSREQGNSSEASQQRRMAELERLVGRQQMEIRFLAKALRQVEERRQPKNDGGAVASSKR